MVRPGGKFPEGLSGFASTIERWSSEGLVVVQTVNDPAAAAPATAPVSFECKICQVDLGSQNSLASHYNVEHGGKRAKCCDCGEMFKTNSHLSEHCLKKHGIEPKDIRMYRCLVRECKENPYSSVIRSKMLSHVESMHRKGFILERTFQANY